MIDDSTSYSHHVVHKMIASGEELDSGKQYCLIGKEMSRMLISGDDFAANGHQ